MRVVLVLALALSTIVFGCGPSVTGRACDSTDPCPNHFVCAPAFDGVDRCMSTCSLNPPETVCHDGTVCLPITATEGACYLGGNVAIRGTCMSDLDCTRTAICVGTTGSTGQCFVGCNFDGTHDCTGGFFCQHTSGSSGYCGNM
jgi:hypothetical protein